jgi:hypothetical protein
MVLAIPCAAAVRVLADHLFPTRGASSDDYDQTSQVLLESRRNHMAQSPHARATVEPAA